MMTSNGGTLNTAGDDWEVIPIMDSTDRKRLARSCNNIITETASFREWRGFPIGAVAIAVNGSGDCILFLRHEESFHPQPFVWSHETGGLAIISDDFAALVQPVS